MNYEYSTSTNQLSINLQNHPDFKDKNFEEITLGETASWIVRTQVSDPVGDNANRTILIHDMVEHPILFSILKEAGLPWPHFLYQYSYFAEKLILGSCRRIYSHHSYYNPDLKIGYREFISQ